MTAARQRRRAGDPARRARRLLRWYPAAWRARYGAEFSELLVADFADRPRCWQRTADIARSGLLARLSSAGLTSYPLDPATAARAGLATLACALAAFGVFGAAMWAQLSVDWQWVPPPNRATTVAMVLMSAAMGLFALLALLALIPLGWAAVAAAVRGRGRPLRWPALLIGAGALVLFVGGRHFGNGWPGTGGHWWPHQGLVPGGVAAFNWACTLPVTSYWAHPDALAAFPAAELAWMAASPAAMVCLVTGAAKLVRRLDLPARMLRYQAWLGAAAGGAMAVFLAGALCWAGTAAPAPHGLFRVGTIDRAGLMVLVISLGIGWQAWQRVWGRRRPERAGGPG